MKTLTYGIMHFVVAFAVSYVLTGSLAIAGAIAMVEPLVQTFAYHFHEKAWKKVEQVKQEQQQEDKPVLFVAS